jgi:hypothetical protein
VSNYLVALLGSALATTNGTAATLGAVTADVAALAASVAGLVVLGALGAVAAFKGVILDNEARLETGKRKSKCLLR